MCSLQRLAVVNMIMDCIYRLKVYVHYVVMVCRIANYSNRKERNTAETCIHHIANLELHTICFPVKPLLFQFLCQQNPYKNITSQQSYHPLDISSH